MTMNAEHAFKSIPISDSQVQSRGDKGKQLNRTKPLFPPGKVTEHVNVGVNEHKLHASPWSEHTTCM